MTFKKSSLAIAITVTLFSLPSYAETSEQSLETITVTSNFKKQSLASTPTSIAIIDQQQLKDQSVQHFDNVLSSIANVNFSGGTARPKYLQIRGVGERSEYQGAPNSSVGFIIDDIDLSGLGMAANLYDVNQVEVLRGPQGTRFGANALAGLIYIQSNQPTDVSEHGVSTSFGDDQLMTLSGFSSGALSSKVNYRVSLEQHQQNGYSDNIFLGRDDTNAIDELTGKMKINAQATDDLSIYFTLLFANMDNGFDAWTLDNNGYTTYSDEPGVDNQKSLGSSLKFEYTGFNGVDLTAISSFTTTDHQNSYDGDWSNAEYWATKSCDGEPCVYDYFWSKTAERDVLSQEFRFNNKAGNKIFNQRTDWLLGVYISRLEEDNITDEIYNGWASDTLFAHYKADNFAVFGQLDSQLSNQYQLSVGLRVEKRESDYKDHTIAGGIGDVFNPSETMWGGHIAVSKPINDNHNAYVRIARGYKAGGFNMGLPTQLAQFKEFDTETLINYELGFDSSFADNSVRSRLAFFYMDRKDQQVNASQQNPEKPQQFTIYTANATSSSSYGMEMDLTWDVTNSLSFYTTLGYLRAKYDTYAYFDKYGSSIDISDRELAHAPKFTYSLGGTYRSDFGIFFNAYMSGKSSFYFSDSHSEKSESSDTVNARIGYETQAWSLYLWGRNLTDEKVATRGFYFGNEPDIDWAPKKYQRFAAPRQLGLTFDYRF
ncbi:TonB-dependent receptor [Thalassotalea profundi]|uniref:TonB-dependent receptor n=1 Tax=Thalassotalea profundi TaxID=2036687 RepID=A0ABQ3IH81_9GAMM|nr:TonB-dependent receptor [Thalassotalea profundi]GHE83300.1 TonB-dependent receptor [Thalassotalea profundi]